MGVSDIVERLDKYQKRLSKGKADKIKPRHVEEAIRKLGLRETALSDELKETEKPGRRGRLEEKLGLVREQIKRAEWLKKQI